MAASNIKTKTLGGPGAIIGDVVNIAGAGYTYYDSKKSGDSTGISIVKAGADFAFGELMSGFGWKGMLLYAAATAGTNAMIATGKQHAQNMSSMANVGSGRVGSGHFNMSGAGYTMRQRGINQLRTNGQNLNSVLGNEARNYLKSARDYT